MSSLPEDFEDFSSLTSLEMEMLFLVSHYDLSTLLRFPPSGQQDAFFRLTGLRLSPRDVNDIVTQIRNYDFDNGKGIYTLYVKYPELRPFLLKTYKWSEIINGSTAVDNSPKLFALIPRSGSHPVFYAKNRIEDYAETLGVYGLKHNLLNGKTCQEIPSSLRRDIMTYLGIDVVDEANECNEILSNLERIGHLIPL